VEGPTWLHGVGARAQKRLAFLRTRSDEALNYDSRRRSTAVVPGIDPEAAGLGTTATPRAGRTAVATASARSTAAARLGLRMGQCCLLFRHQAMDQPMQRIDVLRQSSKIKIHRRERYARNQPVAPASTIPSQSAAASARDRGLPGPLRRTPVDALNQHRQLLRGETKPRFSAEDYVKDDPWNGYSVLSASRICEPWRCRWQSICPPYFSWPLRGTQCRAHGEPPWPPQITDRPLPDA
jgi:hypothetical protein